MKYLLTLILLFLPAYTALSQDVNKPVLNVIPAKIEKLKNPNSEVEDYLVWLQKQPQEDHIYLRGFTTYAIPQELRGSAVMTLSFLIHSMTGISTTDEENASGYYPLALGLYDVDQKKWDGKAIAPINQIPGSTTLFWIDIRNYNWALQSWENITKYDGYFVEPIVNHANNGLLRLISGNSVVRADWFIYHASRSVEQNDIIRTNNSIYRELLYSKVKPPKNVDEFRKVWSVDVERSRVLGNEFATLVTKSKNVARHNRILFGYRSELGWMYQSYDVKSEQGKRDYVDTFYDMKGKPPTVFDGGEIFATNALRMQVYDIYDDKLNLADFADATLVRHLSDIVGDARVVNPHSCFDCHSAGPVPSENTMKEYLAGNGGLYLTTKADQLRVDRAYNQNKFEESIAENQELYKKALHRVNGLTPEDNLVAYNKIISWYSRPVDLQQAAAECGVTVQEFTEKNKGGLQDINNKIHGRVAVLLATKEPIPRAIWEAPNTDGIPGAFQQAMIAINGLTQIVTQINYVATVNKQCNIYKGGTEVLRQISEGTRIPTILSADDNWTYIQLQDGTKGYIHTKDITKE